MRRRARLALALLAAAVAGWCLARFGLLPPATRTVRTQRAPVGGLAEPSALALPELPDAPVRNVVLLIGDGLGSAQTAAARIRAFGPDGRFLFERFPVSGLVATHPRDDLVSKSDSSATALATGVKTVNGRIGTAVDGARLSTLVERARERGAATGLVTSSYLFDATPAAFVAHVDRRRDYDAILDQMAASGVDLVAGGGLESLRPAGAGGERADRRDLLAELRERGVRVVTDRPGLAAARELPLWAVFPGRDLGSRDGSPPLGELAEKAIGLLAAEAERRGTGFFLLLEEEGTDSAAHDLDVDRLAAAVLRLDRAVEAAARFAIADGSTLVLLLADHSTGGLVIEESSRADRLDLTWGGDSHGGEPVVVWAYGPRGAAARFTGLLDITAVHDRLAGLLEAPAAPGPGAETAAR